MVFQQIALGGIRRESGAARKGAGSRTATFVTPFPWRERMMEERYSNTLRVVLKAHSRLAGNRLYHSAWPLSVWPETVFKKCMTCHSKLGETAHNMIAPVLDGLKGHKSGSVATTTPAEVSTISPSMPAPYWSLKTKGAAWIISSASRARRR
jgi:hypothetical protein